MLELWERYQKYLCTNEALGLTLDVSRMRFDEDIFEKMKPFFAKAFAEMKQLEAGAIANPDENRMVGHYWLRAPELAPTPAIKQEIQATLNQIHAFAHEIHSGKLQASNQQNFTDLLVIGIGGSALGPQWIADALSQGRKDKLRPHFLDNTDTEGMQTVLENLGENLRNTLVIVISKSGSTPETRNGMLYAQRFFANQNLSFAKHAVAITGEGSQLYKTAQSEGWVRCFPMWDWVGGRTSELSAVGLLPAALQGIDIDELLRGARLCDEATREESLTKNPAALMALMWFYATKGQGEKDLVMLPYKDKLLLFSRYLQQLIMESLGKMKDRDGNRVNQGITVYGNKGSTDQHAYVQQLREGVHNFFVTFVDVLENGGQPLTVETDVTIGDYLHGFHLGTRRALYDAGRDSMTLTIPRVDPFHLGVLIALFERTVGLYASLIHINAYHQPGVEAGKKAATEVLGLQKRILQFLRSQKTPQNVDDIAKALDTPRDHELIFTILRYLAANKVVLQSSEALHDFRKKFWLEKK